MALRVFLIIFCLFFPFVVQGVSFGNVVINEIAWMGTSESANDEWMELYNTGGEDVSLEGWVLEASDGTPQINLTGSVSAGGFFLL